MNVRQRAFALTPLLPLVVAIALAPFGVRLSAWFYLLLAVVCPGVAGVLWWLARDAEQKIVQAKGELTGHTCCDKR